jgi:hypothetical protein
MGTVQPLSKGKHGFHIHEVSVHLLILHGDWRSQQEILLQLSVEWSKYSDLDS